MVNITKLYFNFSDSEIGNNKSVTGDTLHVAFLSNVRCRSLAACIVVRCSPDVPRIGNTASYVRILVDQLQSVQFNGAWLIHGQQSEYCSYRRHKSHNECVSSAAGVLTVTVAVGRTTLQHPLLARPQADSLANFN